MNGSVTPVAGIDEVTTATFSSTCIPIIAVTARAMFGDKERIMQNQLDDYIAKPYNLNTVVDTLNKYIDGDDDKDGKDKKEADTDK